MSINVLVIARTDPMNPLFEGDTSVPVPEVDSYLWLRSGQRKVIEVRNHLDENRLVIVVE